MEKKTMNDRLMKEGEVTIAEIIPVAAVAVAAAASSSSCASATATTANSNTATFSAQDAENTNRGGLVVDHDQHHHHQQEQQQQQQEEKSIRKERVVTAAVVSSCLSKQQEWTATSTTTIMHTTKKAMGSSTSSATTSATTKKLSKSNNNNIKKNAKGSPLSAALLENKLKLQKGSINNNNKKEEAKEEEEGSSRRARHSSIEGMMIEDYHDHHDDYHNHHHDTNDPYSTIPGAFRIYPRGYPSMSLPSSQLQVGVLDMTNNTATRMDPFISYSNYDESDPNNKNENIVLGHQQDGNDDNNNDNEEEEYLESIIVNDEERLRAIREAYELGRLEALQQIQATVTTERGGNDSNSSTPTKIVRAIPILLHDDNHLKSIDEKDEIMVDSKEKNNNYEEKNSEEKIQRRIRTLVLCFLVLSFLIILMVIIISVVTRIHAINHNHNQNKNDIKKSNTTTKVIPCFPNSTMLQTTIDLYLQSYPNHTIFSTTTLGIMYGISISDWCVSKIQIFDHLFNSTQAQLFNEDLSRWDMSNATSTIGMFSGASLFQGIGLDQWDVSQVINMTDMFDGAWSFNANLSSWDVSNVISMNRMFKGASIFDGVGIDHWNISMIQDTSFMFKEASMFNANLSTWDTSQVITMREMFSKASNFTGIGLEVWNVSRVIDMSGMFWGTTKFDTNLSNWDVAHVRDMSWMFCDTPQFHGIGLEHWVIERVNNMDMMFQQSWLFDNDLSLWNTSQVETMRYMFMNASQFRGVGLEKWNVSRVWSFDSMFWVATQFDANLSNWDVSRGYNFNGMFNNAENFLGVGIENWNMSNATDIGTMFYGAFLFDANLSTWDVSRVIYMWDVFGMTKKFRGIGLENWNVGSAEDIGNMFVRSESFDADLSRWNVSQVMFTPKTFKYAQRFRGIGVDKWDVSNVINMKEMFASTPLFNADLSLWHVSKVKNMSQMFYNATSFTGHGLHQWNVSNANYTMAMFDQAILFNVSLCHWGPLLPHNVNATRMFTGTSCPSTLSPEIKQTPHLGPFCYPC